MVILEQPTASRPPVTVVGGVARNAVAGFGAPQAAALGYQGAVAPAAPWPTVAGGGGAQAPMVEGPRIMPAAGQRPAAQAQLPIFVRARNSVELYVMKIFGMIFFRRVRFSKMCSPRRAGKRTSQNVENPKMS